MRGDYPNRTDEHHEKRRNRTGAARRCSVRGNNTRGVLFGAKIALEFGFKRIIKLHILFDEPTSEFRDRYPGQRHSGLRGDRDGVSRGLTELHHRSRKTATRSGIY